VVFDEPVIKNFVNNQQDDNFVIVGDVFNKQTYGLAFPHDSDLREEFNKELLGLFESENMIYCIINGLVTNNNKLIK
jgi:polar amino acid transport system substrate-binding protein